jgi:hypothetical protein
MAHAAPSKKLRLRAIFDKWGAAIDAETGGRDSQE